MNARFSIFTGCTLALILISSVAVLPARSEIRDSATSLYRLSSITEAEDNRLPNAPALVRASHSIHTKVRSRAALAWGRIQSPEGIQPLLELLHDKNSKVRADSLFALGQLGWQPQFTLGRENEIINQIKPYLKDRSPLVRARAVEAIGKLGMESAPPLLSPLLKDPNPIVRAESLMALYRYRLVLQLRKPEVKPGDFSNDTLELILSLSRDPDVQVKRNLAYLLSRVKIKGSVNTLKKLAQIKGQDVWVRYFVSIAFGRQANQALADLALLATQDKKYFIRVAAINSAKLLKIVDRIPLHLLKDPIFHVRLAFVQALQSNERTDSETLLNKILLEDKSISVRSEALKILAQKKGPAIESKLRDSLKHGFWPLRVAAVEASTALGPLRPAFLQTALKDHDVRVRASSLEALAEIEGHQAFQAILNALNSNELAERGSAVTALSARKENEVLAAAWKCFQNSSEPQWTELREELIEFFSKVTNEETTRYLKLALQDSGASVVSKAIQALKARGISNLPVPPAAKLTYSPFRDLKFSNNPILHMMTNRGIFQIELFPKQAPIHVATIVGYARSGGYDGLPWHRVVSNFVVQGGDPDKTGWGSAGFSLRAEINPLHYGRGTLGMPRSQGFDTGGVQLFISHVPVPHLDSQYTIFGQVIQGMGTVDRLEIGDLIRRAWVEE